MNHTVIIIAGGKGTRSIDPSKPKSLHIVDSLPLIAHQISFLSDIGCKKIIVIGNFGFDELAKFFQENTPVGVNIEILKEDVFGGTLGALQYCKNKTIDSRVWVILGDLFFRIPLHVIERNMKLDTIDCLVLTHPNDHPRDSDVIEFDQFTHKVTLIHTKLNQNRGEMVGNAAIAGVYFINLSRLADVPAKGDISLDLIPVAIGRNWNIQNYTFVEYCKDSGTPERIQAIESDLKRGVITRRSKIGKTACFIDLDDTLLANSNFKNANTPVNISPEIVRQLKKLNSVGVPVIVVTNQPGIAKGFFLANDWSIFRRKVESTLANVEVFVDDWIVCPHHPEKGHRGENVELKVTCDCRKPSSGMFREMRDKHSIDLRKSFMIGDAPTDQASATDVGIRFLRASCNPSSHVPLSTHEALEKVLAFYDHH